MKRLMRLDMALERKLEPQFEFHSVWLWAWMVLFQGLQVGRLGEVHPHWADRRGWCCLSCWADAVHVHMESVWMLLWEAACACGCPIVCLCECRGSVWCGKSLGVSSCAFVWVLPLSSLGQRFWSRESGPHHISDLTQCAAQGQRPNSVNFCHSLDRRSLQMEAWWGRLFLQGPSGPVMQSGPQSPSSPGSPQGHLDRVRELHLGSFIFEEMVLWINERNSVSKGSSGKLPVS